MNDIEVDPVKLRAVRDAGIAFAKQHVKELAQEILDWEETAVLKKDGRLRELANILKPLDGAKPLTLAQSFAMREVLNFVTAS
jgi:hypothetical protein